MSDDAGNTTRDPARPRSLDNKHRAASSVPERFKWVPELMGDVGRSLVDDFAEIERGLVECDQLLAALQPFNGEGKLRIEWWRRTSRSEIAPVFVEWKSWERLRHGPQHRPIAQPGVDLDAHETTQDGSHDIVGEKWEGRQWYGRVLPQKNIERRVKSKGGFASRYAATRDVIGVAAALMRRRTTLLEALRRTKVQYTLISKGTQRAMRNRDETLSRVKGQNADLTIYTPRSVESPPGDPVPQEVPKEAAG